MTYIKFKNGNGVNNYSNMERGNGFPSFFHDTLDRLMKDESVNWMPSVNIKERTNDYKIDLAVPGMSKEDFKVEVENGVLTVSGERKEDKTEGEKSTRKEFHYGTFKRVFTLPETADIEKIGANYKDGLLSLTLGKREEPGRMRKKQITIE